MCSDIFRQQRGNLLLVYKSNNKQKARRAVCIVANRISPAVDNQGTQTLHVVGHRYEIQKYYELGDRLQIAKTWSH